VVRGFAMVVVLALVAGLPVGSAGEGVASADVLKFRPDRADRAKEPSVAKASRKHKPAKHKSKRKRASRKKQKTKQRVVMRPMP
jgi:hypothetical protein